jgi:hypothetical protein
MQCNASYTRFIFLKVFHMNYNLICIFICTPICTNLFILVKSGCYTRPWSSTGSRRFSIGAHEIVPPRVQPHLYPLQSRSEAHFLFFSSPSSSGCHAACVVPLTRAPCQRRHPRSHRGPKAALTSSSPPPCDHIASVGLLQPLSDPADTETSSARAPGSSTTHPLGSLTSCLPAGRHSPLVSCCHRRRPPPHDEISIAIAALNRSGEPPPHVP